MIIGYEYGLSAVAAPSAGAAYAEFQSNATRRCKIREHSHFSTAATAVRTSIGRPANTPTGGAVTVGGAQDGADAAATGGVTTTWTVAPTAPAPNFRVWDFNNVPGSGVIYTWPADGEIVIGLTRAGSLVDWSITAGVVSDFYWIWGE